jgi:hypothetical protein
VDGATGIEGVAGSEKAFALILQVSPLSTSCLPRLDIVDILVFGIYNN